MKDINVVLGERIKLARKENSFTREKLAELIDVSPRFLAEVEAGKVGVSLQTLKKISTVLSVTTDYLLSVTNEEKCNRLDMIYRRLINLDEKYYPLIYSTISELEKLG